MVQVLSAPKRGPTLSEQFTSAFQTGAQNYKGYQKELQAGVDKKAANAKFKELTGKDLSGLPPDVQAKYLEMMEGAKNKEAEQNRQFGHDINKQNQQQKFDIDKQTSQQYFEGQEANAKRLAEGAKPNKDENEKQQNLSNLNGALDTVNKMRKLRKKNNLGRGSSIMGAFGGDTAKDRGEYQTLGNSLIQYASNIPIRNQMEFEKLSGKLSDPNITDDEAEGVLNAMESIINNSMKAYQSNGDQGQPQNQPSPNKQNQAGKPALNSFLR